MWQYIVRRVLQIIPTLLIISFLVFSLLYITPGDPVYLILGFSETDSLTEDDYNEIRKDLGLDKPFLVQYFDFMKSAMGGDLGESYVLKEDVAEMVFDRLPATLSLSITAMFLSILISFPLGILAAVKHNSIWDNISTFLASLGIALPKFWFALVLIIIFSQYLGWFPSQGIGYLEDGIWSYISHMILPAFSLAIGLAAVQMRILRSSLIDVLKQDYVKFAESKGFKENIVVIRHAMKNAMIPVITILATEFAGLLGGSVLTESIFSWPGLGRLALNSISRRDYPMIRGTTLMICCIYLVTGLVLDIVYAWLDPRIRLGQGRKEG